MIEHLQVCGAQALYRFPSPLELRFGIRHLRARLVLLIHGGRIHSLVRRRYVRLSDGHCLPQFLIENRRGRPSNNLLGSALIINSENRRCYSWRHEHPFRRV